MLARVLALFTVVAFVQAANTDVSWTFQTYDALDISVGDTVTFSQSGSHTIVALSDYDACTFDSDSMFVDGEYVFEATEEGTWSFGCDVGSHCSSGMKIQINVGEAMSSSSSMTSSPDEESSTSSMTSSSMGECDEEAVAECAEAGYEALEEAVEDLDAYGVTDEGYYCYDIAQDLVWVGCYQAQENPDCDLNEAGWQAFADATYATGDAATGFGEDMDCDQFDWYVDATGDVVLDPAATATVSFVTMLAAVAMAILLA